jgi:hypothetical protein
MICAFCNGTVTWRGPLSNLTHTECADCGRQNCQQVDEANEDASADCDEQPSDQAGGGA